MTQEEAETRLNEVYTEHAYRFKYVGLGEFNRTLFHVFRGQFGMNTYYACVSPKLTRSFTTRQQVRLLTPAEELMYLGRLPA